MLVKTVTANEYLADVMAALAQRLGFNGALYFGKFAMTYRETEKPAPNIVTHSEVIKFSENLLKYDPSYLGSKKGLLKVIIHSRFVPTMYNTIPAPTKTYLTNICISPFNGVIEQ